MFKLLLVQGGVKFKNYSLFIMECGSKYESESADAEAAGEFLKTLDKLKVEENYLPEQICYMDDTPLL